MKTNEFIKRVSSFQAMFFFAQMNDTGSITIRDYKGDIVCYVDTERRFKFDCVNYGLMTQPLFDLICEYVKTDPADRGEPTLFSVRLINADEHHNYVNYVIENGKYFISNKNDSSRIKTKLTQRQVDNIPWELNEDWEVERVE